MCKHVADPVSHEIYKVMRMDQKEVFKVVEEIYDYDEAYYNQSENKYQAIINIVRFYEQRFTHDLIYGTTRILEWDDNIHGKPENWMFKSTIGFVIEYLRVKYAINIGFSDNLYKLINSFLLRQENLMSCDTFKQP